MPDPQTAHDAAAEALVANRSHERATMASAVLSALGIPAEATAQEIARSSACIVSTCGTCGGTGEYGLRPCRHCAGNGVHAVRRDVLARRREQAERARSAEVTNA